MREYPCGTVVVRGIFQGGVSRPGTACWTGPKSSKNLESPLMRYVHIDETRTTLPPVEGSIGLEGFCGAAEAQATTRGAPQVGMNGIDQNIPDMVWSIIATLRQAMFASGLAAHNGCISGMRTCDYFPSKNIRLHGRRRKCWRRSCISTAKVLGTSGQKRVGA
jgi:hypothetical protein